MCYRLERIQHTHGEYMAIMDTLPYIHLLFIETQVTTGWPSPFPFLLTNHIGRELSMMHLHYDTKEQCNSRLVSVHFFLPSFSIPPLLFSSFPSLFSHAKLAFLSLNHYNPPLSNEEEEEREREEGVSYKNGRYFVRFDE